MIPTLWWFAVFDAVTPWVEAARAWLRAFDAMCDTWIPLESRFTREGREKLKTLRERVQAERVEG